MVYVIHIMKKYLNIGVAIVVVVLTILLYIEKKNESSLEQKWKDATENVKSYSDLYSSSSNQNRAYKLTIDQLESSSDSIFQELCKIKDELKIKDSKLQSLQYTSSTFSKRDTITITDTLFRDPQLDLDSCISEEWYSIDLRLQYPSTVIVQPEFKSKRSVAVSLKKETVNPPKKFFLFRWFQKKHYVINVDVIEKNPYVKDMNNRYVEIVK